MNLRREHGSLSILDPLALLLAALIACLLFVGTAASQVAASASSNSSGVPDQQFAAADQSRLEEGAAVQIQIANPFATPWLLKQGQAEALGGAVLAATGGPGKILKPVAGPAKYTLTPDPFNWSLEGNSPEPIDLPVVETRPVTPSAAQRLAAELPGMLGHIRQHARALSAKYDIARIGDRGIGHNLNFYSIEKEQALGHELAQEVEQQARLINDPVITEYVNRIGQTLVRHSDAQVPFSIKVIDDEQINAFALPGGFFYVNTGVILAAENEAELAGVMAHEIAHVAARHATRNATKKDIWDLASLPLIFVGGPVGAAIRQVSGIAVPLSFLKFSRDAEREADLLGLEYQYAAGYDPTAFVDFFEKLEAREKQKHAFIARAFSTHPMNDERMRRAETELEMLPARDDYILTTSEFDQVKARLVRLTHGHMIDGGKAPHPTLRKRTGDEDRPPIMKRKN